MDARSVGLIYLHFFGYLNRSMDYDYHRKYFRKKRWILIYKKQNGIGNKGKSSKYNCHILAELLSFLFNY